MKIPLLDLGAAHKPIQDEIMEALERVVHSQNFILGPEVDKLEESIARYCQTQFAVGVSSGTDALLVSLMALGVGPGDEVITTPYSFFASAGVIARVGATPVFVDIEPETYNINPALIGSAVTAKTKAVIPVHLFGQCADMAPILRIAEEHDLTVIEDAAQAIGAEYRDGKRAGSMAALGCLSFFPTKNLGALGDGGMVITNDSDLAEKVRSLRVHGSKPRYHHKLIGGNFRLDTIQAAVLRLKLGYLDEWTKTRQANATRYLEWFSGSGLIEKTGLGLPYPVYHDADVSHYHIYNQFVIRAPRRDSLKDYLERHEIGTEVYYPRPLHLQECFRGLGYEEGDFPESERAAGGALALPIYPGLTAGAQEEVVGRIRSFYSS